MAGIVSHVPELKERIDYRLPLGVVVLRASGFSRETTRMGPCVTKRPRHRSLRKAYCAAGLAPSAVVARWCPLAAILGFGSRRRAG
jgi:hypothetical protein